MKFVFIINNRQVYRHLSTLIEESIERSHNVEILHHKWDIKSIDIEFSPFFNNKYKNLNLIDIPTELALIKYIETAKGVDYFFSIDPITFVLTELAQKKVTGRWCIIQHGVDSFATIWHWEYFGFSGKLNQSYKRLFFPCTSFFYKKGIHFLKNYSDLNHKNNYLFFESSNSKIVPIGNTSYKGQSKKLKGSSVRDKYKIKSNKKIVMYLPFSFVTERGKYHKNGSYAWQAAFSGLFLKYKEKGDSKFQKNKNYLVFFLKKIIYLVKVLSDLEALNWLIRRWNEPRALKAVKKFCDKNDLTLIVKTREKYPYINKIYNFSDTVIDSDNDIQQNPSVIQELYSISDLVIGYQSTTVLESILNDTPYLNIELPDSNLNHEESRLFWHTSNEGDMYKYEGVVKSMKIPELITNLEKMKLSDFKFDIKQKKEYMEKYLGSEESNSSDNLIKYLEENKKVFI